MNPIFRKAEVTSAGLKRLISRLPTRALVTHGLGGLLDGTAELADHLVEDPVEALALDLDGVAEGCGVPHERPDIIRGGAEHDPKVIGPQLQVVLVRLQ